MTKEDVNKLEYKDIYLKEFEFFDGETAITFNLLDVNTESMTITVAVSYQGKTTIQTLELLQDKYCDLFFRFGPDNTKLNIANFE